MHLKNLGVSSSHQVHRSPHPLHHLPRYHPVGQVTTPGHLHIYKVIVCLKDSNSIPKVAFPQHLHGPQDGEANMSTSDHGKTLLA